MQSIQASALKFTQDNNDLLINFTNTSSDSIRVSEWFSSADNRIEQLKLDDGSILDLNKAVEAQLATKYGTSANDTLELIGTKTQVIAGTGNDAITDTTANNTTYVFNKGDGKDTIIESNSSSDTIQLNNITPQEISYSKIDNDLIINLGADDSITIKDFTNRANRIENISFSNGMTMLLAEALASAKVFASETTVTSDADDNVWLEQGAKLSLGEGNNQAHIYSNGVATNIIGGAGNDTVEVYDNANVMLTLANGNNKAIVKDGNHIIGGGTGKDSITLGAGVSRVSTGLSDDEVTITNTQTNSRYDISLGGGNDRLNVYGSGGNITIANSSGDDQLNLRNINTLITTKAIGAGGNNQINIDNSGLIGDVNDITLGIGNDQLIINSSGETKILDAGGKNQILLSGGGNVEIRTASSDDIVEIRDFANSNINLSGGNNTFIARDGNHQIITGLGNDNITIGAGVSTINSDAGNDTVTVTATQSTGNYNISLGTGNDKLYLNGNGEGFARVTNSDGNDEININDICVQIITGGGNSIIKLNNSKLSGESNSITTGFGNDTLIINNNGINTILDRNGTNQITLMGDSKDTITTGKGNDSIVAGAGNDTISAGAGNDIINGGTGDDIIDGGLGDDTYILNKGDGVDIIQDAGGNDIMKLGDGIKKEDLWFSKQGSDLEISNLTNQDKTVVKNWYAGNGENQVEKVELANGSYLSNISINQLVQAMATFDVKPMAETSLTPSQQNTIQTALANTWVDPTK